MGAANSAVKDVPAERGNGASETVIPSTEAAESFSDLIDRAWAGERFQVTKYGKDRAYIVGPREYERFVEFERSAKAKRK